MIVLNLKDYNIDLILEDGRGYIPLQTASDFIFAPMFHQCALFNGQNLILADSEDLWDSYAREIKPLGELYYQAQPTQRSQALANFGYNELCLMLDKLYGLKQKHNIEYFGRMFWQVGFDEALASTDPRDADTALNHFISYYLDDLHSGYNLPSWMMGLDDIERKASAFGAVSSGASPSSLRILLISAMSTPFAESAFMKAFLIARTSSWEIDFVFALRRWTWLLILVSLDSLLSATSPAL